MNIERGFLHKFTKRLRKDACFKKTDCYRQISCKPGTCQQNTGGVNFVDKNDSNSATIGGIVRKPYAYDHLPDILDSHINSDSSSEYYNLKTETMSELFDHLTKKCQAMIDLSVNTAQTITGDRINAEIFSALVSSSEVMWIANDLKDLTQPNLQKWYELKSGRLNLPIQMMINLLPLSNKRKLLSRSVVISAISFIWDEYKGILQNKPIAGKEKIARIEELNSDPIVIANLGKIKSALIESGALDILLREINKRMSYTNVIRQKYPDSYYLNLYGLAVDYYVLEKTMKLVKQYPQLMLSM